MGMIWDEEWRSLLCDRSVLRDDINGNILLRLLKYTLYLALMGELWGVLDEDLGENWAWYNHTALYLFPKTMGAPFTNMDKESHVQCMGWNYLCVWDKITIHSQTSTVLMFGNW